MPEAQPQNGPDPDDSPQEKAWDTRRRNRRADAIRAYLKATKPWCGRGPEDPCGKPFESACNYHDRVYVAMEDGVSVPPPPGNGESATGGISANATTVNRREAANLQGLDSLIPEVHRAHLEGKATLDEVRATVRAKLKDVKHTLAHSSGGAYRKAMGLKWELEKANAELHIPLWTCTACMAEFPGRERCRDTCPTCNRTILWKKSTEE